jgi:hypothetical protein
VTTVFRACTKITFTIDSLSFLSQLARLSLTSGESFLSQRKIMI